MLVINGVRLVVGANAADKFLQFWFPTEHIPVRTSTLLKFCGNVATLMEDLFS